MVEVRLGQAPTPGNGHAPATTVMLEPGSDPDTRVVVDRQGRKLVVRRPELLAEFHFAEAAGKEAAENTTWMGMAMPLIYLAELGGVPAPLLRNKLAIDALIKELGREGYTALTKAIQDIVKNDEEEELQIKNA